jgi:hypothetical protein
MKSDIARYFASIRHAVLKRLDHVAKDTLGIRYYVRYMDDLRFHRGAAEQGHRAPGHADLE